MKDFDLTVNYKGVEQTFSGQLVQYGYTHKIVMQLNDVPVVFEPDEERNYRAVVASQHINKVDAKLVELIAEQLEANLK